MIKSSLNRFLILVFSIFIFGNIHAEENVGLGGKAKVHKANKVSEACQPATSQIDLDINNVRTRLLAGGDMWWDLDIARYEIPKVEQGSGLISVSSLFAGALWIGGIDDGGQLKIAAQTYRQTGNDFWPGPLDDLGSADDVVCSAFDKHWKISNKDIQEFKDLSEQNGGPVPIGSIHRSILEWPGRGNPHAIGAKGIPLNLDAKKPLAPFFDFNADGLYNPEDGDYPVFETKDCQVDPDQMIWWIYNDKGDVHSETGGEPIGLEIKAMAFAFATNDEVNDMTFYQYSVTNFSSIALDSVYFGQWVDADLGYAFDDFVGCDPSRSLGICYNGDAVDGPAAQSYGANPPIVGVDFFQGPKKYFYDAQGSIIDSVILGMSKFLYYNNDFSTIGNPEVASHFYGYLSGTWKNGSPFTEGGNGFGGTVLADFLFPDDPGSGKWSECDENNTPADRRFMQSAGAFRLEPGSNNEVIVGVVWVRPESQIGCFADFDAIRLADDKAQALFDNCFKLIDGPDAPDLGIRELDKEIILDFTYKPNSNNFNESYSQVDPIIKAIIDGLQDTLVTDSTYDFEGYILYQLKNSQVSSSEYRDLNKARPIVQVDIKNGVTKIINYSFDATVNANVPQIMVEGADEGIRHSFDIAENAFATGDKNLVNHITYYFSVVAYAHNDYLPYDPSNPLSQTKAYLEGRRNIKVYSAIPHLPEVQNQGTRLNTFYGDGPQLKRIEGVGNMGQVLDLTQASIDEILANGAMDHPVYQKRSGPVDVKIFDPMKLPNADFEITYEDNNVIQQKLSTGATWKVTNLTTGEVIGSDRSIKTVNEQIIPEWGISIATVQRDFPGFQKESDNGFLEATREYDGQDQWLTGIAHRNAVSGPVAYFNWIRAGTVSDDNNKEYNDYLNLDNEEVYENVLDGTWAPMALVGGLKATIDPANGVNENPHAPLRNVIGLGAKVRIENTASIDIVFTSDKTKWTKCVVVETGDDPDISQGNKWKLAIREHASLNKDGSYSTTENGRSWFPGYAINVETGERLNIIFGESSWLGAENGNDMIWNPTANQFLTAGPDFGFTFLFGGKHYIYVIDSKYDEGDEILSFYNAPNQINDKKQDFAARRAFEKAIWVSMPLLNQGSELLSLEKGLIPNDLKLRLRVGRPYMVKVITNENQGLPKYSFNTQGLAPDIQENEVAKTALDEIRVVPNPYYAYSEYETSQLDNRVKITNLPAKCTVSIYTTEGILIRRFKREVAADVSPGSELGVPNFDSTIDWDLKNHKGVPIAGGAYIIHVEAPGIGEKVVKFFGVMRPIDLDSF
jgi:hypothetical protein